jgi:hypothetical protein
VSYAYGSQPPPVSPLDINAGRNRIAQTMISPAAQRAMEQIQQPDGGMATPGVPGLPPDLGQQMLGGQPSAPAAAGAMPAQGIGLASAPPTPGTLPLAMQPSNVMGGAGAPQQPFPPRG